MATVLKKYNLEGKEVGTVEVGDALVGIEVSSQLVKDYIVAVRANARQWTASTKGRSEVNHTKKKPHAQKGGGRSRQGSLAAPQYKGGGRVFTPRPKFDQHVKINQQERKTAISFLISEKIASGNLFVLDNSQLEAPKTKKVHHFLHSVTNGKRVLFLFEGSYEDVTVDDVVKTVSVPNNKHDNMKKSVRNLQKADCALARDISGYDVIRATNLVVTEEALKELNNWLSKRA